MGAGRLRQAGPKALYLPVHCDEAGRELGKRQPQGWIGSCSASRPAISIKSIAKGFIRAGGLGLTVAIVIPARRCQECVRIVPEHELPVRPSIVLFLGPLRRRVSRLARCPHAGGHLVEQGFLAIRSAKPAWHQRRSDGLHCTSRLPQAFTSPTRVSTAALNRGVKAPLRVVEDCLEPFRSHNLSVTDCRTNAEHIGLRHSTKE